MSVQLLCDRTSSGASYRAAVLTCRIGADLRQLVDALPGEAATGLRPSGAAGAAGSPSPAQPRSAPSGQVSGAPVVGASDVSGAGRPVQSVYIAQILPDTFGHGTLRQAGEEAAS